MISFQQVSDNVRSIFRRTREDLAILTLPFLMARAKIEEIKTRVANKKNEK